METPRFNTYNPPMNIKIDTQSHTTGPTTSDATLVDDTTALVDDTTAVVGGKTVSQPAMRITIETPSPSGTI